MAKKKALNGMGTVRKRPDGRYEARYTGADGEQHSLYGKTPTEIAKKLRAATVSIDNGTWVRPTGTTVEEWADVWLRDYCVSLKPASKRIYTICAELHIKPILGSVKLTDLRPMHIRRYVSKLTEAKLAPKSVSLFLTVLRTMLKTALEEQIIAFNPADKIRVRAERVSEMHIIDKPQIPDFIRVTRDSFYGEAAMFALLTGLRFGELAGLRWDCIDGNRLTVRAQLTRINGRCEMASTKTGETRVIVMPESAVKLLARIRSRQNAMRIKAGHMWYTDELCEGLVFRTDKGTPMQTTTFDKAVHRFGKAIGLDGLHPHDLRHSYAVAALRSGVDVKTVQHNLGHSSAAMTLDVYAKYTDDAGAAAASMIDQYISL